jgi:hypothetical protein
MFWPINEADSLCAIHGIRTIRGRQCRQGFRSGSIEALPRIRKPCSQRKSPNSPDPVILSAARGPRSRRTPALRTARFLWIFPQEKVLVSHLDIKPMGQSISCDGGNYFRFGVHPAYSIISNAGNDRSRLQINTANPIRLQAQPQKISLMVEGKRSRPVDRRFFGWGSL